MNATSTLRRASSLKRLSARWLRHFFAEDLKGINQPLALKEPPLSNLLKFTIILLSGATFFFVLWASITPVKELARAEGKVVPSGYTRIVQHLEGGLVKEIMVKEGDFVQRGQLLMKLDGAGTQEDLREQQALVFGQSLESERLHALLDNREPNFSAITNDESTIKEQQSMYAAAKESEEHERNVLHDQVSMHETALARLQQSLAIAKSNLKVAKESRDIYEKLTTQGLVSRTLFLSKESELNTRLGEVENLSHQIDEAKNELSEYKQRESGLAVHQRDAMFTRLHQLESDLAQAKQNMKKRDDRVERLEVRSPVSGYIKGMKVNTIGAVIPAGQTLMEIVPVDDQLVLEVRILPQQIGRISKGQPVQVKVDSYDYVRFGTIPGTLDSISATTFTDESRHEDYYKGKVILAHNYIGVVPGLHPIIPGMTVDADIVTGEKTVLGYLLKPIRSAMHNALTEQ